MKTSLDVLDDRIQAITKAPCFAQASAGCGSPDVMSLCLAAIQQSRGTTHHCRSPKAGTVTDALLFFRETGTFRTYREGRYVCVGASLDVSGWCLLGEPELLKKLLFWCRVTVLHQSLRFYACLLHSVRSFPGNREEMAAAWKTGWLFLRDWLDDYRSSITLALHCKPRWLFMLNENRNPLSDKLIQRHAQCLLAEPTASPHPIATDLRSASWRPIELNDEDIQKNGERAGRHLSVPLSEHVKESNQRLDFLFGFAAAIEDISFQLDTHGQVGSRIIADPSA
jgi:hypothetical protein